MVNCAAYNAVDEAEDDTVAALEVNAFGVRSLARAAAAIDATLVHYGTDFVFDGTASEPYGEEAADGPRRRVHVVILPLFRARARPWWRSYASVSSTRSATRSAMASDAVSPGESMPAACTRRGCRRSRRIRKSEKACAAGAPRARMPLPPGRS